MQIIQKPASLSFENNLSDIIIQKTDETSLTFRCYLAGVMILEEDYLFDAQGYVHIRDLAKFVSNYFSEVLQNRTGFTISLGLIQTFTFTIDDTISEIFTVIKSSADIIGENADSFIRSNFLTRLTSKNSPLNANEFLSFVMMEYNISVTIKYRIFYKLNGQILDKSGTLQTVVDSTPANRIMTFNASLQKVLEAAAITPEHVYEYRLWGENTQQGISLSQFSVYPDYTKYRYKKEFVFRNCFDVSETFIATGKTTTNNRLSIAHSISGQRMKKVSHELEILHTCNTGFLTDEQINWLDDLITSSSVAELVNGSLVDVVLTETAKSSTTANELQAFTFTYRLSKENHQELSAAISGIFDHTFDNSFS